MLYNSKNPQMHFSEDQYLSDEDHHKIISEYDELCKAMLTTDIREINSKFYGIDEPKELTDEEERKKKRTLIFTGLCVIAFIVMAVSLILKQLVIGGLLFCGFFLLAGISLMITGKGEIMESTSNSLKNKVMGGFITLGAVAIMLLIIFRDHFKGAEMFILLFVAAFGLAGLCMLTVSILRALSSKIIYTEQISATCAGYVRMAGTEQSSSGYRRRFTFVSTSPLFRYSYNGMQYDAIFDELPTKKDSDVAMGETVSIRIDPRRPENIMSPVTAHPGVIGFELIMGIIFTVVAVGMGLYTASGLAAGQTVETSWNPLIDKINGETSETTLPQVDDEMIESLYADKIAPGQDWYVEKAVVSERETTEDGIIVSFSDSSFRSLLFVDDSAPEVGTEVWVFYYIDEEYLEYGTGYKRSFVYEKTDVIDYVGQHGSFVEN
ncbi:MAG: hypothetical protein J6Z43_02825 [Clostridiales bacterium]|nr:hypothetical protein [Clostridiales bacterium]